MRSGLSCLSLTWLSVVLLVPFVVGGCGGSGGVPGSETDEGGSVTLGPLQVGVAATAGFRTLVLNSPGSSHIAFTALYGSRIVRLQEVGYGRIAFRGRIAGDDEICVMNIDGTGFANLTQQAGTDYAPAWSPDGRKIAFCSYRDGNAEIYTMNADGTGQTRLTYNAGYDGPPAWSPDGARIAFESNREGDYEIYVMNADGSSVTPLTANADTDGYPAWSPDGRAIAFSSDRDGNWEIYVMGADGSSPVNLSQNSALDRLCAWSPDGKRIAFVSDRNSNADIYAMNADGSGQVRLTSAGESDGHPDWSPDGRRILFESYRASGTQRVFTMTASGGEETRVWGAPTSRDIDPAWCPVPSVLRTLIGPNGSDGDSNPPFGTARPLVVVGMNADGLASAAALYLPETRWGTLAVSALNNIGADLAGLKITGTDLRRIDEDMGRGVPRRQWVLTGSPATGAALVFFSGETGRVASIIVGADTALTSAQELTTQAAGGRIVLQGSFTQAYSAADPQRNLVTGTAQTVALNGRTGEVVSVR